MVSLGLNELRNHVGSGYNLSTPKQNTTQLEQLEHLRSENTHRRPMTTHTIDSYQTNQSESYKFEKLAKISNFQILKKTLHMIWSCLLRCVNMTWIWLVLWKLQSGPDSIHRQMDRRTERWTNYMKPVNPPLNFVEVGGTIKLADTNPIHLLRVVFLHLNHISCQMKMYGVGLAGHIPCKLETASTISQYMEIGRLFNTLRLRQNGRQFADDIFKCIFLNENVWILIKISLKFVPKDPINNIPALVQIMAWLLVG